MRKLYFFFLLISILLINIPFTQAQTANIGYNFVQISNCDSMYYEDRSQQCYGERQFYSQEISGYPPDPNDPSKYGVVWMESLNTYIEWQPPVKTPAYIDSSDKTEGSGSAVGTLDASYGTTILNEGYINLDFQRTIDLGKWHILKFDVKVNYILKKGDGANANCVMWVMIISNNPQIASFGGLRHWYYFNPTTEWQTFEIDLLNVDAGGSSRYGIPESETLANAAGVGFGYIVFPDIGVNASLSKDLIIHVDNIQLGIAYGEPIPSPIATIPPVPTPPIPYYSHNPSSSPAINPTPTFTSTIPQIPQLDNSQLVLVGVGVIVFAGVIISSKRGKSK